jgi:hypothetical protein
MLIPPSENLTEAEARTQLIRTKGISKARATVIVKVYRHCKIFLMIINFGKGGKMGSIYG